MVVVMVMVMMVMVGSSVRAKHPWDKKKAG